MAASVSSGPAPWSSGYKRSTQRQRMQHNVDWSLSGGYRQMTPDWESDPQKPKTKRIKLFNGRYVEVPDADFEDFIGFKRNPTSKDYDEIAQYIDSAFEKSVQEVDGVGHIAHIEYAPRHQVLRVQFMLNGNKYDGATVVYFRVPNVVWGELYHLAKDNIVDSDGRHALGKRFWDLIRIRGQLEGGRYQYQYVDENVYVAHPRQGQSNTIDAKAVADRVTTAKTEAQELEEDYDRIAKGHLVGSSLNEYLKLGLGAKGRYLKRHGLIDDSDDDEDYSDLKAGSVDLDALRARREASWDSHFDEDGNKI